MFQSRSWNLNAGLVATYVLQHPDVRPVSFLVLPGVATLVFGFRSPQVLLVDILSGWLLFYFADNSLNLRISTTENYVQNIGRDDIELSKIFINEFIAVEGREESVCPSEPSLLNYLYIDIAD